MRKLKFKEVILPRVITTSEGANQNSHQDSSDPILNIRNENELKSSKGLLKENSKETEIRINVNIQSK